VGLVESLSSSLLKILPSSQFLKVRNFYHKVRSKSAPIIRAVYGHFSTEDLIREIDSKIDSDWNILMVHSSVNNLAPMYDDGTMELLHALIKYCGPERTLVMPAFNFGAYGEGAREMLKKEPRFDLRRAPSQMGLLTELFRRSPGVVQSKHPIYRVAALGPLAEELTAGHENIPSGMGANSPFDYMAQQNAQIVGIGKPFQVMTQVHHVESLLGDKWPAPVTELPNIPVTLVDKKTEINMEIGGVQQQWTFNIWKLREIMSESELKEWSYHNCQLFAARAGAVTDALTGAAENGFTLYDS
jgi:aminoglycoside 3-N-acetyltransferase